MRKFRGRQSTLASKSPRRTGSADCHMDPVCATEATLVRACYVNARANAPALNGRRSHACVARHTLVQAGALARPRPAPRTPASFPAGSRSHIHIPTFISITPPRAPRSNVHPGRAPAAPWTRPCMAGRLPPREPRGWSNAAFVRWPRLLPIFGAPLWRLRGDANRSTWPWAIYRTAYRSWCAGHPDSGRPRGAQVRAVWCSCAAVGPPCVPRPDLGVPMRGRRARFRVLAA